MTLDGDSVILTPLRNNEEKYILSAVPDDNTGVYEIIHVESGLSLRNFYAQQVRVLLLGGLFLEVTENLAATA